MGRAEGVQFDCPQRRSAATTRAFARLLGVRLTRFLWILFLGLLLAFGVQSLLTHRVIAPQDLPWTPLVLAAPIGLFTQTKIAALADEPGACRRLLDQAAIGFTALPPRRDGQSCGWADAIRLASTARSPRPRVALACPLAAATDLWLRRVVQPAAADLLGSRVVGVDDFGSYACRRIYGRPQGAMSEHASANAIDIAGFRLADGRRITVARDWRNGARGEFLHRVRDGACRLFATALSPDYNEAHRDHLHLDQARRGSFGWRACR